MSEEKKRIIGIPRALLFHRYGTRWLLFFKELGVETVLSPPSSREILEWGAALAIDETCLSNKLYLGHVSSLAGYCDAIFVPRYSNLGRSEGFCTRFEGLYDQTRNLFRGGSQRFLTCDIDVKKHHGEAEAFEQLGRELGFSGKEARRAYAAALKADTRLWKEKVQKQEALYNAPGMKILVAGHSYVLEDAYVGKPITDYLESIGVTALRADVTDREAALRESERFSPTNRWLMSRELVGSVLLHKDRVDGIILLSAFPCGPDSMANELLMRKIKQVPILNLVLDAQSGMAGVETRLESFVDIIRFKERMAV